jgi:hypothetical protein
LADIKEVIKFPDGLVLIHDLDQFLFQEEQEGLGETLSSN